MIYAVLRKFDLRAVVGRVSAVLLISLGPVAAMPTIVTDVEVGLTTVTLTFQDDGSSNQFTLQANLGLNAANWANAPSSTLTPLGGNRYTFSVPRTSADKRFFRIIGAFLGTGPDPDGDGLPTALESTLGPNAGSPFYSNPNLFDTDGDGFSDGVEYSLGTRPNDASSLPDQVSLPGVEFTVAQSTATEGTSPHLISVQGPANFSGSVFYSVNARSNAASPADFTAPTGSFSMSGGSGQISLQLNDNLAISPDRLIIIDLSKNPPGNAYRPAGNVTHVVRLSDNDGYWSGVLQDSLATRDFRVRIQQNASTTQIAFVSGMSDGLPVIDGGLSSQSTGVIPVTNLLGDPQEVFPATGAVFTNSRFTAVSPDMPAMTTGTFSNVTLKRGLTFDANSTANSTHNVTPIAIIGGFTEFITHATDPGVTYLNSTVTGTFVLTRDLPASLDLDSAFLP